MSKFVLIYLLIFFCSVSSAVTCKDLFKSGRINKNSKVTLENQSMLNTTIQGVMSVPQSTAGSIMFYLAKILPKPNKILDVLAIEAPKREFESFDHKEFNKLVRVANHQHSRPELEKYTERAPHVNTEIFSLHRKLFNLKGQQFRDELMGFESSGKIQERMYWRLIEIYRFPVTSISSVLNGVLKAISVDGYSKLGSLRGQQRLEAIVEILSAGHIKQDVEFIADILNQYISSDLFRKQRVPVFQKLPAKLRAAKRDKPKALADLTDLSKDGLIASNIAFDLYPKLRVRFNPEKAFFVSMAIIGYEYSRSHDIFTETLVHRRDEFGLKDSYLKEVLSIPYIHENRIVGEKFFE